MVLNFVTFVLQKKRYDKKIFFYPSLLLLSWIRDLVSGMDKNQDPGSATLLRTRTFADMLYDTRRKMIEHIPQYITMLSSYLSV
jgi:hypothetical protein